MEGTDYLVRTGDVINNYKILAIYKDNVAVQLGDNIYKAGVGELLALNKLTTMLSRILKKDLAALM